MVNEWRNLVQKMPNAALVNVERYAAELDAVDVAVGKSIAAHGGENEYVSLGMG